MAKMQAPHFPIEKEPKIPTMDRPLIIESAFPGWMSPKVNPYIPLKPEDIAREIVDSINAGASVIHVHARDPIDGSLLADPHQLKKSLDPVFEKCPDVVTWNHSWAGEPNKPIDYVVHTEEMLGFPGGMKYIQGSVVLITGNPPEANMTMAGATESIKAGVPYLESKGIKPIFQIYDTSGIERLRREVIDGGLAKWEPYVCNLHMGKHHATYIGQDPWAHMQLLTSVNMLRATIPGCVVGVFAGGRNWLPITATAISMGVDVVRTGVEDCLWVYPHKDEIIKKNSDVVAKVARIARELGREVASPDDARRICGMKKP